MCIYLEIRYICMHFKTASIAFYFNMVQHLEHPNIISRTKEIAHTAELIRKVAFLLTRYALGLNIMSTTSPLAGLLQYI